MLAVSNGWFGRSISLDRVARVVRAGYESSTIASTDHSRHMGPVDWCIDLLLFAGAKRAALDHLYELAHLSEQQYRSAQSSENSGTPPDYATDIPIRKRLLANLVGGAMVEIDARPHTGSARSLTVIISSALLSEPLGLSVRYRDTVTSAPQFKAQVSAEIPAFVDAEHIRPQDLERIMTVRHVSVGGRTLQIACPQNGEPIVVRSRFDRVETGAQQALSRQWMTLHSEAALRAIDSCKPPCPKLALKPSFVDLPEGPCRDEQRLNWELLKLRLQKDFDAIVTIFQHSLDLEREDLHAEALCLGNGALPGESERHQMVCFNTQVQSYLRRQAQMTHRVNQIKQAYSALCLLVSSCDHPLMIDLFKVRIVQFSALVTQFALRKPSACQSAEFGALMINQVTLARQFDKPLCTECCDMLFPAACARTGSKLINVQASSAMRGHLSQSLKDPLAGWTTILERITSLRGEVTRLLKEKDAQHALAEQLRSDLMILEIIPPSAPGHVRSDIHLQNAKYRPAIQARVVSLQRLLRNLRSAKIHFTAEELVEAERQISEHLAEVVKERCWLLKSYGVQGARWPTYSASFSPTGSPLSYEEWEIAEKGRRMNQKVDQIRTINAEVIQKTKENITLVHARAKHIEILEARSSALKTGAALFRNQTRSLSSRTGV